MTTKEAWLVPSVAAAVLPLLPRLLAQSSSTMVRICARQAEASAVLRVMACTKAAPCSEACFFFGFACARRVWRQARRAGAARAGLKGGRCAQPFFKYMI